MLADHKFELDHIQCPIPLLALFCSAHFGILQNIAHAVISTIGVLPLWFWRYGHWAWTAQLRRTVSCSCWRVAGTSRHERMRVRVQQSGYICPAPHVVSIGHMRRLGDVGRANRSQPIWQPARVAECLNTSSSTINIDSVECSCTHCYAETRDSPSSQGGWLSHRGSSRECRCHRATTDTLSCD